ncbi:MAG: Gfo/Idh/MocA family oxidoreductase [Chloroflexota bacterium]
MEQGAKPVGIGVIGLNWGLGRCAAINEIPEARLVAVASRTEQTARAAQEKLGVPGYSDYKALLRDPQVEIVAIYTPSALHRDIAIDAARAGKHVMITKPIEVTLERCDAVIDACREAGVKLVTEYMSRYAVGHYRGYRAVADGLLGRPVTGEFTYKCYRPQWYYTGTRGTWAVDGGGALLLQAIHTIDLMLWYYGPVESVTAICETQTHQMETEDTGVALLRFVNGALATVVGTTTFHNDKPAGQYGGGSMTRMEIGGERGSAILLDGNLTMWKTEEDRPAPDMPLPAANAFQDFARWVRDDGYRSPMLVTGSAGRDAVALILAMYESSRTGKTIRLTDR